jgi:hypothetical protein
MKVIECKDYNQQFPETFTWGHVQTISLCNLANTIVCHVEHDLKTTNRSFVGGLRLALNLIAEQAEI